MKRMDYDSVRVLELTCPKASASDAQMMNERFLGRLLSKEQQDNVKGRALKVDTLIPSFYSFFRDLNYLEFLVNAIKKLHRPGRQKCSLRQSLRCVHTNTKQADRAWRELFLYAMRNYYINVQPKVEKAQLNHYAKYARDRGFDVQEKCNQPLVTHGREVNIKKEMRSGLPKKKVHSEYCEFLSIKNMEATSEDCGEGIINFFVRKAVYRAFFAAWRPPCNDSPTSAGVFDSLSTGPYCSLQTDSLGIDDTPMPDPIDELFDFNRAGNFAGRFNTT